MAKDKYTATWVSHSSIRAFVTCPRAYYLNNVYKDPKTGHKITLMSPPLALGQAVHEVIDGLSVLPVEKRLSQPLATRLDAAWKKVSGKRGGFVNKEVEERYKMRGKNMLKRLLEHPGPLKNLAVKIKMDLPYFWLSEEDNIILCGKIDWLEYLPDSKSVHIIDFKTNKRDEDPESLQLPIYYLIARNCQKYEVAKASYWYLERNDKPTQQPLPEIKKAKEIVLKIAKKIKLARQLGRFNCPYNGCHACKPLEAVVRGEAEFVGSDEYNQDVYILKKPEAEEEEASVIL